MAETISKVLYPADNHIARASRLRLKQQYLLVSASLQEHPCRSTIGQVPHATRTLPDKQVAIHINDTHPALCHPGADAHAAWMSTTIGWDEAWDITCQHAVPIPTTRS